MRPATLLRRRGYDVAEADGLLIVNGPGVVNLMIDAEDNEALDSLLDKKAHEERVRQDTEEHADE